MTIILLIALSIIAFGFVWEYFERKSRQKFKGLIQENAKLKRRLANKASMMKAFGEAGARAGKSHEVFKSPCAIDCTDCKGKDLSVVGSCRHFDAHMEHCEREANKAMQNPKNKHLLPNLGFHDTRDLRK